MYRALDHRSNNLFDDHGGAFSLRHSRRVIARFVCFRIELGGNALRSLVVGGHEGEVPGVLAKRPRGEPCVSFGEQPLRFGLLRVNHAFIVARAIPWCGCTDAVCVRDRVYPREAPSGTIGCDSISTEGFLMAEQAQSQSSETAQQIAREHVNDPKTAAATEQAAAASGLTGR